MERIAKALAFITKWFERRRNLRRYRQESLVEEEGQGANLIFVEEYIRFPERRKPKGAKTR